jgi:hypothetical protein
MISKIETLKLPEGNFNVNVDVFEESDKLQFEKIYKAWRELSSNLKSFNARAINLPEGLSEGAFCLAMDCVRFNSSLPDANTSWDCYDLTTHKRIQVKACSVLPDLTSFGPKSQWDEIYFLDFYRDGSWNGKFDIYLIDNNLIYNHKVNANQTLRQQQLEGRRPRFSIYKEIIEKKNQQPICTYGIF